VREVEQAGCFCTSRDPLVRHDWDVHLESTRTRRRRRTSASLHHPECRARRARSWSSCVSASCRTSHGIPSRPTPTSRRTRFRACAPLTRRSDSPMAYKRIPSSNYLRSSFAASGTSRPRYAKDIRSSKSTRRRRTFLCDCAEAALRALLLLLVMREILPSPANHSRPLPRCLTPSCSAGFVQWPAVRCGMPFRPSGLLPHPLFVLCATLNHEPPLFFVCSTLAD
jgi:hypothetical protein